MTATLALLKPGAGIEGMLEALARISEARRRIAEAAGLPAPLLPITGITTSTEMTKILVAAAEQRIMKLTGAFNGISIRENSLLPDGYAVLTRGNEIVGIIAPPDAAPKVLDNPSGTDDAAALELPEDDQ